MPLLYSKGPYSNFHQTSYQFETSFLSAQKKKINFNFYYFYKITHMNNMSLNRLMGPSQTYIKVNLKSKSRFVTSNKSMLDLYKYKVSQVRFKQGQIHFHSYLFLIVILSDSNIIISNKEILMVQVKKTQILCVLTNFFTLAEGQPFMHISIFFIIILCF